MTDDIVNPNTTLPETPTERRRLVVNDAWDAHERAREAVSRHSRECSSCSSAEGNLGGCNEAITTARDFETTKENLRIAESNLRYGRDEPMKPPTL